MDENSYTTKYCLLTMEAPMILGYHKWDYKTRSSDKRYSLRNYGKSQALHAGFRLAKGRVVVTMDADLQDSPEEIPALYQMIVKDKYDLVSGWKKRYDNIFSKKPSFQII